MTPKTQALELILTMKADATLLPDMKNRHWYAVREDELLKAIATAFAARERAVWMETAKAYERYLQSLIPKAGDWKPPQSFADWCKQQAEAVQP